MTAPLVDKFTPSPDRAWGIAHEGGIRLNNATKVSALIHAAAECDADYLWIGDKDRWLTLRRLMHVSRSPDDFVLLVAAVKVGDAPLIRARADRLVNPS